MNSENGRLYYNSVFNSRTLNIFTDASIKVIKGETVGCPGAVLVNTAAGSNQIQNIQSYIVRNSTNNHSEILAIELGVYYAVMYKDRYSSINLFSDSNICIQGLTNWLFSWKYTGNVFMNSSGKPVANQEVFLSIIKMILDNNLNINFYHQKGHVNISSNKSINRARISMMKTNNLSYIDNRLLYELSMFNDIVDIYTKQHLNQFVDYYSRVPMQKLYNCGIQINELDLNKYKELI